MANIDVHKPSRQELEKLGATAWPIWTCDPSTFDWEYDEKETCYILEGKVTVKTDDGSISFGPGDLVTFPQGLKCVWRVDKPVRKHYKFG
jgi:uncharacterized protein